jgi:putative transposase
MPKDLPSSPQQHDNRQAVLLHHTLQLSSGHTNALAEAFNSLFKAELVRNRGPWKNIDDLEIAVAEYIDWFNHRRLHGEIGLIPPTEHEDNFYRHNTVATTVAASVPSLH